MKEYIFPKKVVDTNSKVDTKNLLKKQPMQIGLNERYYTIFEEGEYVILDYGKEMCGSLRILTFLSDMVKVRIRFGESLTECCSELGGKQNATNDHALRDFETELPRFSDLKFGNTGFRFVRIDFSGKVVIKSLIAENNILKKPTVYTYQGKDARIKEIFDTAKRTVDLCAAFDYLWDGVKRDRLVWIGDIHPEMLALTTLYGRLPLIERSLDFVRDQTPLPGWMNGFPMYSMWWIIILADYYKKTKVDAYIEKQLDYLQALVSQMDECVKEDGELNYPSYFVDWPTHNQPDELHGVRAINIMAMKKAIELLAAFNRDTAQAQGLLDRLVKIEIAPQTSKQVTGLKFFATELNDADKKRLVEGGPKGMSTFMSYYILKAVASFDKAAAIDMMNEFYGAMLDKGATTFWEDFDMSWVENTGRIDRLPENGENKFQGNFGAYCYEGFRHSLCHGWSAGIIQFIKEEC